MHRHGWELVQRGWRRTHNVLATPLSQAALVGPYPAIANNVFASDLHQINEHLGFISTKLTNCRAQHLHEHHIRSAGMLTCLWLREFQSILKSVIVKHQHWTLKSTATNLPINIMTPIERHVLRPKCPGVLSVRNYVGLYNLRQRMPLTPCYDLQERNLLLLFYICTHKS